MMTNPNQSEFVRMPENLLAAAHGAADEEHRTTDELVSDAVRRYLRERKPIAPAPHKQSPAHLLMESPLAEASLDLERRKEYVSAGAPKKKRLSELFAVLGGSGIDLSRNPSTGAPGEMPPQN